jgi:hypothetical protein
LVIHYISLLDTYFINQFIKNNRCLFLIYIQLLNYTTYITKTLYSLFYRLKFKVPHHVRDQPGK